MCVCKDFVLFIIFERKKTEVVLDKSIIGLTLMSIHRRISINTEEIVK